MQHVAYELPSKWLETSSFDVLGDFATAERCFAAWLLPVDVPKCICSHSVALCCGVRVTSPILTSRLLLVLLKFDLDALCFAAVG